MAVLYSTKVTAKEAVMDRSGVRMDCRIKNITQKREELPPYPLGDGPRRVWRFRLSEIAAALSRIPAHQPVEFNVAERETQRSCPATEGGKRA
jgi:hypothetical protein